MTMPAAIESQTYFPNHETRGGDMSTLVELLDRDLLDTRDYPYLVDSKGKKYSLPETIVEPLVLIAQCLIEGKAVSIVPRDQVLTTQQAADFLGISRPTFVSILERGDIPFEKLQRHRRVKLSDVVEYRARKRVETRKGLGEMSHREYSEGVAERTVGVPPAMR